MAVNPNGRGSGHPQSATIERSLKQRHESGEVVAVLTVVGGPIGRSLWSNPVTVSDIQLETSALRAVIISSTIRLLLDDDRCDFAVSTTDAKRHITQRATHRSGRGVDTQTVPREVVIHHRPSGYPTRRRAASSRLRPRRAGPSLTQRAFANKRRAPEPAGSGRAVSVNTYEFCQRRACR